VCLGFKFGVCTFSVRSRRPPVLSLPTEARPAEPFGRGWAGRTKTTPQGQPFRRPGRGGFAAKKFTEFGFLVWVKPTPPFGHPPLRRGRLSQEEMCEVEVLGVEFEAAAHQFNPLHNMAASAAKL
jgi:hypothetical protein